MKTHLTLFVALIGLFIIGCDDNDILTNPEVPPVICDFVLDTTATDGTFSDREQQVLQDCHDAALTDHDDIRSSLIGATWVLDGIALPWGLQGQLPCAHATFTADQVTYHYHDAVWDTTVILAWHLSELIENTQVSSSFRLTLSPATEVPGLDGLDNFCPDHIWQNHLPVDGSMHFFSRLDE